MFEHSSTAWCQISLGPDKNLLSIGVSNFSQSGMHVSFGLRGFFRGWSDLLDHSYQVSKGFGLHLLYRPAALNLYRAFRSSEFGSDLFVEHSSNNHGNYFLLARSQRVKTPPNIRHFVLLFPPRTIPIKCDANSIEKILVPKRLGKEFDRSRLHCTNTHGNVAVAGKKNYGDTNISRRKLALKIETAQSR